MRVRCADSGASGVLLALLGLLWSAGGCSNGGGGYAEAMAPASRSELLYDSVLGSAPGMAAPRPAARVSGGESATGSDRVEPTAGPQASSRLMIYTGRFLVLVGNVEDAVTRYLELVEGAGGYLERRDDGDVTCRIPAARYFGVIERIPSLGQVLSKSLEAQDVTRQVMDLEIRMENAEVSRKRLIDLLAKATETEAILKIEQELRRLTVEIEQMKGSLTHLRDQIAFSTLQVVFRANAPEVRPPASRSGSLFPWISRIGAERVLEGF